MQDAVAVALIRSPQPTFVLLTEASARLVRTDGKRRKRPFFVLAHAFFEAIGDRSGKLRHAT